MNTTDFLTKNDDDTLIDDYEPQPFEELFEAIGRIFAPDNITATCQLNY